MPGVPRTAVAPDPAKVATGTAEPAAALWQRWCKQRDQAARGELIELYMPHARTVAASVYALRTHNEIEFNEYLQLACVGLIEAVDRYDPALGAQFKTYASHRMRGATLDGLERLTEKNQQIAVNMRLRRERFADIKAMAKEKSAVARKRERQTPRVIENALFSYLAEAGIGIALAVMLDGTGMLQPDESDDLNERAQLPAPDVAYFRKSETRRLREILRELIDRLPEEERRVVRYHYEQEIPFDQISTMLAVSRGRVSQLHQRALANLRKAMGRGPPCDVSL